MSLGSSVNTPIDSEAKRARGIIDLINAELSVDNRPLVGFY